VLALEERWTESHKGRGKKEDGRGRKKGGVIKV